VARDPGDQVETNFTRGTPYKIWDAKKFQNSARFLTTFEFDREYLRNGSTYRNSEKYLINFISSPIGRKKFGELWSTNQKVIDVHFHQPNWTFSGDYISALRGAGPSNFYTLKPLKYIASRTWGAGRRAASSWALPHIISSLFFN